MMMLIVATIGTAIIGNFVSIVTALQTFCLSFNVQAVIINVDIINTSLIATNIAFGASLHRKSGCNCVSTVNSSACTTAISTVGRMIAVEL